MKVYELIGQSDPTKAVKLFHPELGNVDWLDAGNGYGFTLVWADGPEKGQDLAVDEIVLFDDEWEIRS